MAIKTRQDYFPGINDDWERRRPKDVGMRQRDIDQAIDYHREHSTAEFREGREILAEVTGRTDPQPPGEEPFSEAIGPVKRRGPENGLILRHGYLVAEWGNTRQVDMTYSVTKSYLATVAGLALDRGLIDSVHDRVGDYVVDGSFESEHNRQITWEHLLHQNSEWDGTLWGKPDWADRPETEPGYWHERELTKPGTRYKYNDVRVNLLALALLHVWRRPLPQVMKELVKDPVGASPTWRWHGYFNSWVTIDGLKMQSVSGGCHWGGGIWIHSRDHARFGYLHLRRGRWNDQQLLSEKWIDAATAPSPTNEQYGYMWWLNTHRRWSPSLPASSYFARGMGSNIIWIDPEHDIVAVTRWIDKEHHDGFAARVLASLD
jgi:CubicO group peptidase (beta-lactamase class C family)